MASRRRMIEANCHHCGAATTHPAASEARPCCSRTECIHAESDMHNAAVAAYRAERAARPKAPRRPRQPQPLYGDFAQLAAFHGVATDGTGRRRRP